MEAFANQQGVRAAWSNEVASLEHGGVRLVVTALVLENDAQPSRLMRGVRIDLSRGTARERIFLDAEATERTVSALNDISQAVARHGIPGNGCMGAKEFWPLYDWPWNKYHELNADVCETAQTLVLHGRGKQEVFRLPNETPAQLAEVLTTALEQGKQHANN